MEINGSEKINLVKPHILLIGLVLVAFNRLLVPNGNGGVALNTVDDRLSVL